MASDVKLSGTRLVGVHGEIIGPEAVGAASENATSALWVPPRQWYGVLNSVSDTNINRWPVWRMLLDSIIASQVWLPDEWSAYNARLYWTNATTAAGNVTWRLSRVGIADGDTIGTTGTLWGTGGTTTEFTVAAPAENVVKVTDLDQAVPVTSGKPTVLNLLRSSASDTVGANHIAMVGLLLTKAA